MRQAREIIRLKFSAFCCDTGDRPAPWPCASTVRETLKRVDSAGLTWPLPEGLNDGELEAALYANRRSRRGHRRLPEPDWPAIHRELKRKHVTLLIVWDEYIAENPSVTAIRVLRAISDLRSEAVRDDAADARGGRAAVCRLRRRRRAVVVDRLTGEIRMAQIFVAVLGASSFTFARASWTQTLPDWIDAHVTPSTRSAAFRSFSSRTIPRPSSRPASMTRRVNRTYAELAAITTPPFCRRDRESQGTRRRSSRPCSLSSDGCWAAAPSDFLQSGRCQYAIGELLTHLNEERPIRRLGATRRQLLEQIDRPALKALRPNLTSIANGARAVSALIITSTPASTITACLIASPAPRSTCG